MKKPAVLIALAAALVLALTALAAFVWPGFLARRPEPVTAGETEPSVTDEPLREMQVYFIDVGQGDSTLITDGEHTVLIDAGPANKGNTVYSQIHEVCKSDHIDVLIITHNHSDHTGGLTKVLADCKVDTIYYPLLDEPELFQTKVGHLLEKQQENGAELIALVSNMSCEIENIKLLLHCMKNPQKENDASIITQVNYGDVVFLIMGDAEVEAELDYLVHSEQVEFDCDVLRIGHHGSDTSTSNKLLDAVKPEFAIISVGSVEEGNEYGFPDDSIISRLAVKGCNPWTTKQFGTIVAVTDGKTLSVRQKTISSVDVETCEYIGNGNPGSKKLHERNCSSVSDMKKENKVGFNSIEEAVAIGYIPCKNCLKWWYATPEPEENIQYSPDE